MDYKKPLSRCLFGYIIYFFLAACDTEAPPEPLEILGTPSETLYYDSLFEFELGASGGDGEYGYRYIANPEKKEDRGSDFVFNPIEMTIEKTNIKRNKPSFALRVTPPVPPGVSFESLSSQKYKYQIELTDGKNTILQDYEFTLTLNDLKLSDKASRINEGLALTSAYTSLLRSRKIQLQSAKGTGTICRSIDDRNFNKTERNGAAVYPVTVDVRLLAPVTRHTEFKYRIVSGYLESAPERDRSNIGFARPNVDFLDVENSLVFEAGEQACIIHLDLFDDSIVEGDESLTVEIFRRDSGFVKFSGGRLVFKLLDNEPPVLYTTKDVTRNENEVVTVPISITSVQKFPISINVAIDDENTTASSDQYILTPQSGVITIPTGTITSSYSVKLISGAGANISDKDSTITVVTDIDNIITSTNNAGQLRAPYKISINQWPFEGKIANEVIASTKDNEEVKDIAVDADGIISALIKKNINGNVATLIKSYNKNGSSFNFLDTGNLLLKQGNLNITPISVLSDLQGSAHIVTVVAEVDGTFSSESSSHFGGRDFIIAVYSRVPGGHYALTSVKQYGTEGDDFISGAVIDNHILYVYGKTNGKLFEGVPGFEINQGGYDGFVYKINISNNAKIWSRFIGSIEDDSVASVGASRSEVIILTAQKSADLNAFIRKVSTSTSLDKDGVDDIKIATLQNDISRKILFDQNDSVFHALMESDANLPSGKLNLSLSHDVYLLSYEPGNNIASSTPISTSQDDFGIDLALLKKDNQIVVGGYTFGEFPDNNKKGTSGSDAFISWLSTSTGKKPKLEKTLQFGTPGEDKLIDIEEVSERKFMVLWSENYSSGNGDTRYRISAFTPEGEKLSLDPQ